MKIKLALKAYSEYTPQHYMSVDGSFMLLSPRKEVLALTGKALEIVWTRQQK
jgi:hypothetical protein